MRRTRFINSKAERGYILVFVLGVLMTLGLLLGDISTRSHLGGSILLNSAAQVERRLITGGGTEIGIAALAQHLAGGRPGAALPHFETELAGTSLMIEVEDECGKLNLRTADTNTMARLFGELGFDRQSAQKMSLSILNLRQDNATNKRPGPGSLEAFVSLDAFDASVLPGLSHFVTVYCPRRSVSVWSAPREVLMSLAGSDRRSIESFVDSRSSYEGKEQGLRMNLRDLSEQAGRLSTSVSPIYTIRSSIRDNGKTVFSREQLVLVGATGDGKPMVLRTTFPRHQEEME